MADWARRNKKVFITVGAAGGKRYAHKVEIADLSETTHDPLLAQLRYQLRKNHGAPKEGKNIGVATVFSREAVAPPDGSCAVASGGTLNCHGYGSLVTVTATFGLCAAGWVIDKISAGI
jgi:tRNA A37 threonylcarbamoyladenosine dehydratase